MGIHKEVRVEKRESSVLPDSLTKISSLLRAGIPDFHPRLGPGGFLTVLSLEMFEVV